MKIKKKKPFSVGIGKAPGVVSIGGRLGPYGASVGVDNGRLFGSANVRGKSVGSFGPKEK